MAKIAGQAGETLGSERLDLKAEEDFDLFFFFFFLFEPKSILDKEVTNGPISESASAPLLAGLVGVLPEFLGI
ncbi:MAG: hypothetical protein CMJ52_05390 [Planctomycetaceae bacterium]|nr:hypothetical protein [Planctomycetaceae bacterium]